MPRADTAFPPEETSTADAGNAETPQADRPAAPVAERVTRAHLLVNVKSGRGSEAPRLDDIEQAFADNGIELTVTRLKPKDDIAKLARTAAEGGAGVVISGGGDGTMNGVASGLVDTDAVMGILPLGTFNYLARSLDIPQELDGAVKVIAEGHLRPLNVGMVNDRLFLNNASFGIYPQILRERETVYARWGRSRIAAYWSVLRTMARLPRPLKLRIGAEGEELAQDTPLAFAVTNAFQLRQMGLDGAEAIERGQIALLVAPDVSRARLLWNGLRLVMGMASKNREFQLICADEIDIKARRKSLLVARDGERSRIKGPFHLEMRKGALQVIAPSETSETAEKAEP